MGCRVQTERHLSEPGGVVIPGEQLISAEIFQDLAGEDPGKELRIAGRGDLPGINFADHFFSDRIAVIPEESGFAGDAGRFREGFGKAAFSVFFTDGQIAAFKVFICQCEKQSLAVAGKKARRFGFCGVLGLKTSEGRERTGKKRVIDTDAYRRQQGQRQQGQPYSSQKGQGLFRLFGGVPVFAEDDEA